MKPYLFKRSFLCFGLAAFLFSCGGGGKQQGTASSEFEAAKQAIASDVRKILDDMPAPSEIPYLLMATGADYDADIINPIENASRYLNDKSKATLNLGLYATDIAYMTSYDQSEAALQYMNECQKLANPVGVADAIDLSMVARFEENMANKDSLAFIIDEIIETTEIRLSELDEMESAVLLLAGSWIEGIYLSTSIIDNYPEDLPEEARTLVLKPIVKIVIEQRPSLIDLLEILDDVEPTESIEAMKAELTKVKELYDHELQELEDLIILHTGDFTLTPSSVANLSQEIARIRGAIVE